MQKKYDIVVAGGGTSGCACAYTASLLGLKTLLIEKSIHLGGAITSGLVIPAMKSSDNQINTDFFEKLSNMLKNLGGQVTYMGNIGWFNPELTKIALDRLMLSANVDIIFAKKIHSVEFEKNEVLGIFLDEMLSEYIETTYLVDATGDCEIAKLCDCDFLEEKFQSSSLRFQMSGVDLEKFSKWLLDFDKDRNVTTCEVINGDIHLSTACTDNGNWSLRPIFDLAIKNGDLEPHDCTYFQIFTVAGMKGTINFNAPRIELNPLNIDSKALIEGRESILRLSMFCCKYFQGFENAYISNISDIAGIRVSRRIRGKYVYTKDDLISGKTFKNPVLNGNYPIDIHSNKNGKLEKITRDYQLPVESLISSNFENLFVIGRAISADFEAQSALRIQPSCFSMGEGLAKFLAKEQKKTVD